MTAPILCWVRRDFRLADNPMLTEAAGDGRPVIPVHVLDEVTDGYGVCPRWRLGLAAGAFAAALDGIGSRLIFRRGAAGEMLVALAAETGAEAVWWARVNDPDAARRDDRAEAALRDAGVEVRIFPGQLLFEPDDVSTGQGGPYKVYTPFWNAVRGREVPAPLPAVTRLTAPGTWPATDDPADWALAAPMRQAAEVVRPYLVVGEDGAARRLATFMRHRIAAYAEARNLVAEDGTSNLSENLTTGEISPRTVWHAGVRAREEGKAGAETFLKEIVWREFAHHLAMRTPRLVHDNWREEWDAFPWKDDERAAEIKAWKQGRTGIPFVDAAMREMWVTGTMHNRARMIVASYLTKHLMTDWKVGLRWFEHCLADWDPANNALGWQWVAGSGPDASPYFRVFNPLTQQEKFDPDDAYVRRWIAEGQDDPPETALDFFRAAPKRWSTSPDDAYPKPVMSHDEGRRRALAAYEARRF